MVHYGWACGASWQMLRHASVWEPAVRGRGRRDAAATQHRLIQAIRQAASLHTKKKGKRRAEILLQYDIHRAFWKAVRPPTPTYARWTVRVLCAASAQIDCINLEPTSLFPMRQMCSKCLVWFCTRRCRKAAFYSTSMGDYFLLSIM